MAVNLKGRSFLTLADFTPGELRYLLDLGHDLKAKRRAGICEPTMKGKHIVLLFEKTSTRTRCSFEVAATQEGAHVTYLDANSSQMGKKESLEDSAKVLGRFFDGIEYRGFGQEIVEELANYAGVPVFNGLTNEFHPTQILADFLTIQEHFGRLKGIKLVYLGDGQSEFTLELTWLKDRTEPYNLGECEFHLAFRAENYEEMFRKHQEMGCVVFVNEAMGIYFITDPDGYWIEIIP